MSESTVTGFVNAYIKNELGSQTKCGNWSVINWGYMDVLQYQSDVKTENRIWDRSHDTYGYQIEPLQPVPERIAYRLNDGSILYNSNVLRYATKKSYGKSRRSFGGQTDIQQQLERAGCIPLPFTLFDEVPGMDVRDFSWIVKPSPENIRVKVNDGWDYTAGKQTEKFRDVTRHFSGACVFAIGNEHYLFDIDRHELTENKIFNPFVSRLPVPVSSIQEAYSALMPDKVKEAIAAGIEVKRQGEFFFILHSIECPVKVELSDEERQIVMYPPSRFGFGLDATINHWDDNKPYNEDPNSSYNKAPANNPAVESFQIAAKRYNAIVEKLQGLRAVAGSISKGTTGSHNVEKYLKDGDKVYVSGKVSQSRREHGDLILEGWYTVIGNTSTLNWTISGKID